MGKRKDFIRGIRRKMEIEELVKKLSFKENRLYLDGKQILNVPGNTVPGQINIVEVNKNRIYIGTGGCCHGYLFEMEKSGENDFRLDDFFSVDFNIFEMTPVATPVAISDKSGLIDRRYFPIMLVTGYGCTGSGARIVSIYDARSIDVVTSAEYKEFERKLETGKDCGLGKTGFKAHKLNLDYENNRIGLELYDINRRVRAGMTRQKGVPECLMTAEEEYYNSNKVNCTMDLTQKLQELGVDIPLSLELAKDFRKIYSKT